MSSWSEIVTAVKSVATQVTLGGDLTHISLPSVFCLPYTTLQMIATKRMISMDLLNEIPTKEDPLARMLIVISWCLAGFQAEEQFGRKPLNPIIGETFRCKVGEFYYIGEQVSHHPPISAFYFEHESKDISLSGASEVIAKFYGNSVAVDLKGANVLRIDMRGKPVHKPHIRKVAAVLSPKSPRGNGARSPRKSPSPRRRSPARSPARSSPGRRNRKRNKKNKAAESAKIIEKHQGSKKEEKNEINDEFVEEYLLDPALPRGYARGLLVGQQFYEIGGPVVIQCKKTNLECEIEFKLSKYFFGGKNKLRGSIKEIGSDKVLATFSGGWDEIVKIEGNTKAAKKVIEENLINSVLFDRSKVVPIGTMEVFSDTRDGELKPSMVVWGDCAKAIQGGDYPLADIEKHKVESAQHKYFKQLTTENREHEVRFFNPDERTRFKVKNTHSAFQISEQDQLPIPATAVVEAPAAVV